MGHKSNAKIKNIMLAPVGNEGEIIMAIQFDRKVELPGVSEFGFPVSAKDAVELHRQLGQIISRGRLISLPGLPGFRMPRSA